MTPREVAERWGCGSKTVRRRCESGALRALHDGTSWRIAIAEVEAYEQRNTTSAEPVQAAPMPAAPKEVRPPVKLDGFTLPDGYVPVFPDLWGR